MCALFIKFLHFDALLLFSSVCLSIFFSLFFSPTIIAPLKFKFCAAYLLLSAYVLTSVQFTRGLIPFNDWSLFACLCLCLYVTQCCAYECTSPVAHLMNCGFWWTVASWQKFNDNSQNRPSPRYLIRMFFCVLLFFLSFTIFFIIIYSFIFFFCSFCTAYQNGKFNWKMKKERKKCE